MTDNNEVETIRYERDIHAKEAQRLRDELQALRLKQQTDERELALAILNSEELDTLGACQEGRAQFIRDHIGNVPQRTMLVIGTITLAEGVNDLDISELDYIMGNIEGVESGDFIDVAVADDYADNQYSYNMAHMIRWMMDEGEKQLADWRLAMDGSARLNSVNGTRVIMNNIMKQAKLGRTVLTPDKLAAKQES